MKFFAATTVIAACMLIKTFVTAQSSEEASWGYKQNDPEMASPEHWAEHFPICGGTRQSPINIETTTGGDLTARSLSFSGSCGNFTLTQSDESFKGAVVGSSCSVSANDASYTFNQFHMHSPSEHTINGQALDGEVHFVHSNSDGSALLVVGLFFQAGDFETDPWMVAVLDGMDAVTPENSQALNLASYANLVNTKANADRVYNYPGSLTTPACNEIVDWWVVPTPVQLSSKDLGRLQTNLKKLHVTDSGKNARPVQALNGRTIASLK
ncbi:Carbonic anhydrase [Phytophthora palmivora]|uniref:carbonic anhydrase n=1 Tax=Phytophthora palmivora TaxID=4796 RepID=A0A2P4XQZ2_9STRA|nr:Carbonic anhydrase [Phytophthora palmivora]